MNATHIIARMKHHKFSGRMAWLARWMERKGWLTVALETEFYALDSVALRIYEKPSVQGGGE
jgi:hypothetical protein